MPEAGYEIKKGKGIHFIRVTIINFYDLVGGIFKVNPDAFRSPAWSWHQSSPWPWAIVSALWSHVQSYLLSEQKAQIFLAFSNANLVLLLYILYKDNNP